MRGPLLEFARRYADAHVDRAGAAATPLDGLVILRETAPTMLQYAVSKPLVALVLQGSKRVTIGSATFDFGGGESLLITTDVPTVSQITTASRALPYYSLVLELDPALIAGLVGEIGVAPFEANQPVRVNPTEAEVADAALRLLRLLDRPATLAVLGPQLKREMHYWLLSGRHGGAIRALGVTDSHAQRIARAVAMLRTHYAEGRGTGRDGRDEPVRLPRSFPQHHVPVAATVPEAAPAHRGSASNALTGRGDQRCRIRCGVRERSAVHA